MEFFPFFRRPYYYYQNRYVDPRFYQEKQRQAYLHNENKEKENVAINNTSQTTRNNGQNDEPAFEIFGIKLYFDDILIIALIFFLYNEGVKDNFLFISLILILLS